MTVQATLRPANAGDLDAILALERATPEAPHWPAPVYADILAPTSKRALFVAETSAGMAGFAVGVCEPHGELAELESVVVDARNRRAGIGRALCNAVIDWCQSRGATAIALEVRASSNAIALYADLGFQAEGRRTNYYREPHDDALLMRLRRASTQ
jgi:[ribosomal protein S18]-alanine N-acetyltransferase